MGISMGVIFSFFKKWILWILLFLFIISVGSIGWYLRFNEFSNLEKYNFIFENMIWFAFELLVIAAVVNFLINKKNEKLISKREFSEYYSIAEDDIDLLIQNFKKWAIEIVTFDQTHESCEINNQLEYIFENRDKYFKRNDFRKRKEKIFGLTKEYDFKTKKVSHVEYLPMLGERMFSSINNHIGL